MCLLKCLLSSWSFMVQSTTTIGSNFTAHLPEFAVDVAEVVEKWFPCIGHDVIAHFLHGRQGALELLLRLLITENTTGSYAIKWDETHATIAGWYLWHWSCSIYKTDETMAWCRLQLCKYNNLMFFTNAANTDKLGTICSWKCSSSWKYITQANFMITQLIVSTHFNVSATIKLLVV